MKVRKRYLYKIQDDESGLPVRSDKAVQRATDGLVVERKQNENHHPQLFIRAGDDPKPVDIVRKSHFPDTGVVIRASADKFSTELTNFVDYRSEILQPKRYIQPTESVDLFSGESVENEVKVLSPVGPATHLFQAGIGKMVIGDSSKFTTFSVSSYTVERE